MEIKRGKYVLCSDAACCWIEEEYKSPRTDTPQRRNISGWYPNFRMLADAGLPSHVVRSSDAKSFRKLVQDMKKVEEKISRMTLKKVEELTEE